MVSINNLNRKIIIARFEKELRTFMHTCTMVDTLLVRLLKISQALTVNDVKATFLLQTDELSHSHSSLAVMT